ncbi:MAG: hypothetical protein JO065_19065 [Acidobacteria bacterium]|nr:hypothetical protein [Acidobacteriota bacterium]
MNAEQESRIEKAIAPSAGSLEKIGEIDRKLESLEAGLKELADAFRKFSEGFAKSFAVPEKRVARTSVTVSKEDDYRPANRSGESSADDGRARQRREGTHADADPGFLEAMKQAHARPALGA